jgi:hypothetical protein
VIIDNEEKGFFNIECSVDNVRVDDVDAFVFENYEKTLKAGTVTNIGLSVELTVHPMKRKQHPKVNHKNTKISERQTLMKFKSLEFAKRECGRRKMVKRRRIDKKK